MTKIIDTKINWAKKMQSVHEKRIIYFSKPTVNSGDGDEEDSNRTEKNLGNRQSHSSQQGRQQPPLTRKKFEQETTC